MSAVSAPNGKKVLIVEDDASLADYLSEMLQEKGFQIRIAGDGEEGLKQIQREKFDLIFVDIRLPKKDGVSFFLEAKQASAGHFVAMTGGADVLNAVTAHDLGFFDFIRKPFTREDVETVLGFLQEAFMSPKSGTGASDEYCRVPIEDFVSGSYAALDIFIKVGKERFIRVGRKGSPVSRERLSAYKMKGLKHIYIRDKDFSEYVKFNQNILKAASAKRQDVSEDKKIQLSKHVVESCVQDIYVNGLDKGRYEVAAEQLDATLDLVKKNKDLSSLLAILQQRADKLYAHSVAVSLYSTLIANEIEWTSDQTKARISMAGLLHDIGKKELPPELLAKSRSQMTEEEVALFKSHPSRGKEILSRVSSIPNDVIVVTAQHHENVQGQGYPNKMTKLRIHPFALVVAVADEFCEYALGDVGDEGPMLSAHEAIERMYSVGRGEFDPAMIKALMQIFDYPVPKELARVQFKKVG